jgi:dienelactone hydrolase
MIRRVPARLNTLARPLARPTLGRLIASTAVTAALVLGATAAQAQLARLEIHAVPSVTLEGEAFLTGEKTGKPAMLAGELRLPKGGTERVPAVVLIHGSGGIGPATDRWAWELNSIGIAAFILDSFAGRGITSTVADQTRLNSLAMTVDAYRALDFLAEHPRIDPKRIAVMGFSKGAVSAVYSSLERFRKMHGSANIAFAAHVGFYTPCNVAYTDDEKTTGKPIRMFHGIADDYVAIGHCRSYVERLTKAGVDVTLTEYPDAQHAFDNFTAPPLVDVPQGQTTRNCFLKEGEKGAMLNIKTGQPYDIRTDPCVEKGPHTGYNKAAHEASVKAVKEFLTATLLAK